LAGRLASLNRFISRSAERNLPFFEILKSVEVFRWGPAQQKAFEELNQYLIDLTTLTPPSSGAPLLLYVPASHAVVSAALVVGTMLRRRRSCRKKQLQLKLLVRDAEGATS
jgi:hypothetical protein